ncbi:anthranilate synthase component I family protein [Aquimarina agarivorans]|uniref:anthranilate synthase component I family protein n=1 Tax=Aquimarina agarivorans TaxID=980584 RepID=UPI000248EB1F|nr:anthranilate synthase component I family protein [Aquimarina agarivorans]
MRITKIFNVDEIDKIKLQLLQWAQQFEEVIWLDSNKYQQKYGTYDAILAVDAFTSIKTDFTNAFEKLNEYQQETKDWLFGYLTYDLKNATENLISQNTDGLQFADLSFFQPKKMIILKGNILEFHYLRMVDDEIMPDFNEIKSLVANKPKPSAHGKVKIRVKLTHDQYRERVQQMQHHILRGDIYEANFCQEFYAENTLIDPLATYNKLNAISHAPFAAFLKLDSHYALCASPERYILKKGQQLVTQPIKGTAKRSSDVDTDKQLLLHLKNSEKERAENVMIVDLVRNDLSKTAEKGSVKVTELCGIYSFAQVHQMISTVESVLKKECTPTDALKSTFPMGSMTGAPKFSAMQIIENLEVTKRGLYSGSIGYFTPNGDFDFNVVIRSILYNESEKYVSYSVGSAITAKSAIDAEYEECLLKAKAMRQVLEK